MVIFLLNPVTIARGSFQLELIKTGLSDAGWKIHAQNPGVDIEMM